MNPWVSRNLGWKSLDISRTYFRKYLYWLVFDVRPTQVSWSCVISAIGWVSSTQDSTLEHIRWPEPSTTWQSPDQLPQITVHERCCMHVIFAVFYPPSNYKWYTVHCALSIISYLLNYSKYITSHPGQLKISSIWLSGVTKSSTAMFVWG